MTSRLQAQIPRRSLLRSTESVAPTATLPVRLLSDTGVTSAYVSLLREMVLDAKMRFQAPKVAPLLGHFFLNPEAHPGPPPRQQEVLVSPSVASQ
jgi:hypothetical protein